LATTVAEAQAMADAAADAALLGVVAMLLDSLVGVSIGGEPRLNPRVGLR
jgi:hypothetical protein